MLDIIKNNINGLFQANENVEKTNAKGMKKSRSEISQSIHKETGICSLQDELILENSKQLLQSQIKTDQVFQNIQNIENQKFQFFQNLQLLDDNVNDIQISSVPLMRAVIFSNNNQINSEQRIDDSMSFEAELSVPEDAALPDENINRLRRDFKGNQEAEKVSNARFSYLIDENRSNESLQSSSEEYSLSSSIASGSSIAFTIEDIEDYNNQIIPSSSSSILSSNQQSSLMSNAHSISQRHQMVQQHQYGIRVLNNEDAAIILQPRNQYDNFQRSDSLEIYRNQLCADINRD